jgi:5'(3')-deoxyribonucleotidase
MRPTVLLDCDGVIADYHKMALDILYNLTGRRYQTSDVVTWDTFHSIDEPPDVVDEVYQRIKSRGNCEKIEPFAEAKEGIERLKELADIVIVTSPFKGSPTWAHEREVWLKEHFDIEHVIHTRRKARVHGDFFIDDKTDHVNEWLAYWVHSGRDTGVTGIHWTNGRTSDARTQPLDEGARTASDWSDVQEFVRRRTKGRLIR